MAKSKPIAAAQEAADGAAPAETRPSLIRRLAEAHRAAEKAGDHHGAAALNGVLVALGEAKHRATTALTAVEETLDGRVLREARELVPEIREMLTAISEL